MYIMIILECVMFGEEKTNRFI